MYYYNLSCSDTKMLVTHHWIILRAETTKPQ